MPKQPRLVFRRTGIVSIYAFPPNRDTLGASAYLIVGRDSNLLIDCPGWHEVNQKFLQDQGGIRWLFLTHRGGIAHAQAFQQTFQCELVIQEQEAYLLPGLQVTRFQHECTLTDSLQAIWTPGHSPGSACLYYAGEGGLLFSGRHLLPNAQGDPVPLRTAKTFHWRRQLQSVQALRDRFSPETLQLIYPGANTGLLRGAAAIDRAYERLVRFKGNELGY